MRVTFPYFVTLNISACFRSRILRLTLACLPVRTAGTTPYYSTMMLAVTSVSMGRKHFHKS